MEGESLGPYQIEHELGTGGMGVVYAATLSRAAVGLPVGSRVALKVVHPHLLETEGFFKRFLLEAQIGRAVQHANVVRTLDCDAVSGHHFLVMEYVAGQTLRELCDELGKIPEELCRHVGQEICKGLTAIHDAGVVHRDLKPENVLITKDNSIKVMDLGVARLADELIRLSQSGAFVGSVEYGAPEQFTGGHAEARTDLHALGVVLYELASGQHPYRGDDFRAVMARVCHEPARRLGRLQPQISSFFEEVVHTLLAKQPEDRFPSAAHVASLLAEGEESIWWHRRASEIRALTHRPPRRVRVPRETAVYGRDAELESLQQHFESAVEGDGRVVVVEGEAGIGKSRLVDELCSRLEREGRDFHFLYGSYPPGGAATASGAFSTAFREQLGDAGCAAYLQRTPGLVPAFDALLCGEPVPSGVEPLTRETMQTCFVHATRGLASERPLVLLIEDLHFAPDEALSLFSALALSVPGHRVLLIATTRPETSRSWLGDLTRLEHTDHHALTRLGPKDLVHLLQDSLSSDRSATQLAAQIAVKSDGNPFFVFEIVRGLREGNFLTRTSEGSWVTTGVIDEIAIPSSVQDLVNTRVSGLAEEERELLDVAACYGFEFHPLILAEVVGEPPIPLLKKLRRIEQRHRVVRSMGRRFVFDHHQVQETLYVGMPDLLREEYHALIGNALEHYVGTSDTTDFTGATAFELANHFLHGGRGDRALPYIDAALTHLEEGYLNAAAVGLCRSALEQPGLVTGRARVDLLIRMARRLALVARRDEEHAAFREALTLAGELDDPDAAARAHMGLAAHYGNTVQFESAREHAECALEAARQAGLAFVQFSSQRYVANIHARMGRFDESRAQYEACLEACRREGDREAEAAVENGLGVLDTAVGRMEEAIRHHERSTMLAKEVEDTVAEGIALGDQGIVYHEIGRLADAHENYVKCLELFRTSGDRLGEANALANLGELNMAMGHAKRARSMVVDAATLAAEIGYTSLVAFRDLILGQLADDAKRPESAIELLHAAIEQMREDSTPREVANAESILGDVLIRQGCVSEAKKRLERALTSARSMGAPNEIGLASGVAALLPDADIVALARAVDEHAPRMRRRDLIRARHALWQATGHDGQLQAARKALQSLYERAPLALRESMLTEVRLHRAVLRGE